MSVSDQRLPVLCGRETKILTKACGPHVEQPLANTPLFSLTACLCHCIGPGWVSHLPAPLLSRDLCLAVPSTRNAHPSDALSLPLTPSLPAGLYPNVTSWSLQPKLRILGDMFFIPFFIALLAPSTI